jgi:hypothetical protein
MQDYSNLSFQDAIAINPFALGSGPIKLLASGMIG